MRNRLMHPAAAAARCNQQIDCSIGRTRTSIKYFIKYGCFGNHKSIASTSDVTDSLISSYLFLNSRVTYHGDTSHFFGIGISRYQIQPVSVFFGRYCCTVRFGGNTFLRFCGNSFIEKFHGNSFFSSKGGRSVQRGGRGPPFLGKRGLPPIVLGAPAKILIPKILTEFSFGIGMVNTEKYRPIPTEKYRLGKTLY